MNKINWSQVGAYLVILGTGIAAFINAVIPFVTPQTASILVVIASIISSFLHKKSVASAVAMGKSSVI